MAVPAAAPIVAAAAGPGGTAYAGQTSVPSTQDRSAAPGVQDRAAASGVQDRVAAQAVTGASAALRGRDEALARREAAKAARVAVPKIAWKSCGSAPALAKFQCATVEVPTDYDRPRGATTTIALTRLPASDPARKIGTLFTNPGGPGGPGVDFVQQAAQVAYTPQVRARFDILGFDPRGVGKSDPVLCFPTAAEEAAVFQGVPPFPLTPAETAAYTRSNLKLAAGCLTTSPDRLKHYSTANVARDLDVLRRAVGDDKLSYAGYSYGTYLGATYAKLFPSKVRALVLDGTLSPEWYSGSDGDRRPVGVRLRQGEGGAETFAQFLAECKKAGAARCPLAQLGDPSTVTEALLERLKTHPVDVPLGDGTTLKVTYQVAVQVIFFSLYDAAGWTDLAGLLAQLAAPVRTAKVAAVPQALIEWNRRKEQYTSIGSSLQPCIEARHSGQPLAYQQFADEADRRAPHFGRMRTWVGQTCEFMPVRDGDAFLGPWKLSVKAPVLVFGTRYDPATPYRATRPYADLYPDARMVTVEGYGHATIGKSSCADAMITAYLVGLKAPADNSTCTQDRKPFEPPASAREAKTRVTVPALSRWGL
ncbi:TAP domain protein [Kribbella flavida DSM 17836]|uniref:TAP domain protein n=2 Tax=Kribbella flavida TaxID=182640 RepID=D2PTQ0_KRIFD|nr:TAP domain protein [Kribbella flavida DSM 17836]